jgi:hypothetical protein
VGIEVKSVLAVLAALAITGCATSRSDGCSLVHDPDAPGGFTVYSCPHAFPVLVGVSAQEEHPGARLGGVAEFQGVTSCVDKTIYVHDTYAEVLDHEYAHARSCQ